jgi:hypothetical protein
MCLSNVCRLLRQMSLLSIDIETRILSMLLVIPALLPAPNARINRVAARCSHGGWFIHRLSQQP